MLSVVEAPNPSELVREAVGTPSVAEAAVVSSGAELVLEKRKSANATVAIGRLPVRGGSRWLAWDLVRTPSFHR